MKTTGKKNVRLTTDVIPKKYEIHLTPDLEAFVFEGQESIHLSIKKPTKRLTLHCLELEILSANIGADVAQNISYDETAETATIVFKKTIPAGARKLTLAFRGVLNDRMHGFYRSSYEHGGKKKYLATTQFESTDARRAFPCFDEPAMKAIFEVSLTVPAGHEAISNTVPVDIAEHEGGYKTIRFSPTPVMSTYLLAFIVGDFEHIEKKSADGVLVRVFTTPGKKQQAKFALDCAAKIITFYNTYFDIPYPLPVVDLIAIPDFAAGAMENWGAITYRETALLVDEEHSSTMNKQWVALVIGHELAHQWFGNLVTMEWWTHLWLNEGFASYIEYLAVDHVFPEWDVWTQFLVSDLGRALVSDGLKHTHPIEVDVRHPAEIAEAFDAVSYSKGASIIRMIAEYLGEKKFRDGLRRYLKQHRFGNAETADLWRALEKVSGKPVASMMANWTGKAGYPLLAIAEKKNSYELRQARFFASPLSAKRTRDATLWRIPVSAAGSGAALKPFLMSTRSARMPKRSERWLKLNANESGFYRTSYPESMREALGQAVERKELRTRDRLGLVRDVMALPETGAHSSVASLRFAQHYAKETEYVVWAELSAGIGKIHSLLAYEAFLPAFERFALGIFAGIGKRISWNSKPVEHSQALLKVLVLENLVRYGDAAAIAHARKLFATSRIPADLRSLVYYANAKYGGSKEQARLLAMYKNAQMHEEKNRIGRALAAFRQKTLLRKTLVFALSKDVRSQDAIRIIALVALNPAGRDIAWRFAKKNWNILQARYRGTRELGYLLDVFGVSAKPALAQDIERLLRRHPAPGTERTLQQVLERIRSNAAWLARDTKALASFCKNGTGR